VIREDSDRRDGEMIRTQIAAMTPLDPGKTVLRNSPIVLIGRQEGRRCEGESMSVVIGEVLQTHASTTKIAMQLVGTIVYLSTHSMKLQDLQPHNSNSYYYVPSREIQTTPSAAVICS
jgi:hypothetical protein